MLTFAYTHYSWGWWANGTAFIWLWTKVLDKLKFWPDDGTNYNLWLNEAVAVLSRISEISYYNVSLTKKNDGDTYKTKTKFVIKEGAACYKCRAYIIIRTDISHLKFFFFCRGYTVMFDLSCMAVQQKAKSYFEDCRSKNIACNLLVLHTALWMKANLNKLNKRTQ